MSTEPAGAGPAARTSPPTALRPPHRGRDRVLGGVCSGLAARIGVEPWLVRAAALALLVLSAGTAVLGYALAWALMPAPEPAAPPRPAPAAGTSGTGVRAAWSAVGTDVRSLATELAGSPTVPGDAEAAGPRDGAHAAGTGAAAEEAVSRLGRRLRRPEVRAAARQAADRFGAAIDLTVEELARRASRTAPGATPVADAPTGDRAPERAGTAGSTDGEGARP